MVNYDEAYKIAKELKSPIDICTEYEKGFVFGYTGDGLVLLVNIAFSIYRQ